MALDKTRRPSLDTDNNSGVVCIALEGHSSKNYFFGKKNVFFHLHRWPQKHYFCGQLWPQNLSQYWKTIHIRILFFSVACGATVIRNFGFGGSFSSNTAHRATIQF
jgi:hypothetical protein